VGAHSAFRVIVTMVPAALIEAVPFRGCVTPVMRSMLPSIDVIVQRVVSANKSS
jgi:hypothetical protein